MAVEVVEGVIRKPVRMLSPMEEESIRAQRRGEADAAMERISRMTLERLRADGRWLVCDCREGATMALSRRANGKVIPVNLPNAAVPHAPDCDFAPRGAGAGGVSPLYDLVLSREPAERGAAPGEPAGRPWSGGRPSSLAHALKTLMLEAGMHRYAAGDGLRAPEEWREAFAGAANGFRVAGGVPMRSILVTDPAQWGGGAAAERLDALAARWPGRGSPFGLLSWIVHEIAAHELDPGKPGRVAVRAKVASPTIGRDRIAGPYLFLGMAARDDDGSWACIEACAQPVAAADWPAPVDSGYERGALAALRGAVDAIADDAALRDALGGTVRVALEKPLFDLHPRGGPCRPDALIVATRPGARGQTPGGPDRPAPDGPFAERGKARYVVEVMGFDDAEYEREKRRTHARMRDIGRVVRMEGPEFDSPWNDLERQTRAIARRIREDLRRRWDRP